jgi:ribonuclease D
MDTEADSLHSYPEKLCLLQLSWPQANELVDPLAAIDLEPLLAILKMHELIMHGADYDLRLLFRGLSFVPQAVFDTMLAARFLGCRQFGLTDLVARYLGARLEKGPQKADWGRRPLTERMAAYARNDTRYLKPLADLLRHELEQKGRLAWHQEACARLVTDCTQLRSRNSDTMWRIGGSERLSRKGLAVLRELWHWREQEAIGANKPPYFVLSHELLIQLAEAASIHKANSLLPAHWLPQRRLGALAALERPLALPPNEHPQLLRPLCHRLTESEKRRYEEYRKRRDRWAAGLELDAAFIASRTVLIMLAREPEAQQRQLMQWQRDLLETGR